MDKSALVSSNGNKDEVQWSASSVAQWTERDISAADRLEAAGRTQGGHRTGTRGRWNRNFVGFPGYQLLASCLESTWMFNNNRAVGRPQNVVILSCGIYGS